MWHYVDGAFVEDADASVPLTDRSFLYGDGCFEGIGIREGKVLHLREHIARLGRSARMLRIELPVSTDELCEVVLETASRNGMHEVALGYLRPLLSRGSGFLGLRHTSRLERAHLYVIAQLEPQPGPASDAPKVSSAALSRISPIPPSSLDPRIKANNYLPHILALLEAQAKDADVAIHCDSAGFVSEAHAMNIFCVRDGRIVCPPEAVALAGITRSQVIAVAEAHGYQVTEQPLTAYDLVTSDEVFMTSSLDGVAALSSIDGVMLPGAIPGPVTQELHREYLAIAVQEGAPVPLPTTPGVANSASEPTRPIKYGGE